LHENSGEKKAGGFSCREFRAYVTLNTVHRCQHYQVQGRGLLPFAIDVKALVEAGVQDEADGIFETFSN